MNKPNQTVVGSIIDALGTVRTVVNVDSLKIPFMIQLVSKQVDIPCDGILGRDFLEHAEALMKDYIGEVRTLVTDKRTHIVGTLKGKV
jgi:hypothetical protein